MTIKDKIIQATDFSVFKDEMFSFIQNSRMISNVSDFIRSMLRVFYTFPNAKYVSYYSLNELNLEFDHLLSFPEIYAEDSKSKFDYFIDHGLVGRTIQNSEITISNDDSDYFIIIPLISANSILGLILIQSKDLSSDLKDKEQYTYFQLFTSLLADRLENIIIRNDVQTSNELFEQKLAAKTINIKEGKREFSSIFESIHTAILVIDLHSNMIVKANPIAMKLIKDSEENILGSDYREYLSEEKLDNTTQCSNYESVLTDAGKNKIHILRNCSIVNVGKQVFRIENFQDMSERKKTEETLRNANEILELKIQERTEELQVLVHRLKEQINVRKVAESEILKMLDKEKLLNKLKSRFVSMVSHEFRTPLTIIRSSAQLLRKFEEKFTKEEREEYIERILKTVDNMKDLIENAIFIGQSDSVKLKVTLAKVLLSDLVKSIIDDIKVSLKEERTINYSSDYGNSTIITDSKLIRNILVNLISNALKYSSSDQEVEVRLYKNDNESIIEIKDYGIGIPDDEQKSIFELFYRGENVGKVSGTGLGMPVVLKSVQQLGGRINLSSKVDQGTTFTVTLPNISKIKD